MNDPVTYVDRTHVCFSPNDIVIMLYSYVCFSPSDIMVPAYSCVCFSPSGIVLMVYSYVCFSPMSRSRHTLMAVSVPLASHKWHTLMSVLIPLTSCKFLFQSKRHHVNGIRLCLFHSKWLNGNGILLWLFQPQRHHRRHGGWAHLDDLFVSAQEKGELFSLSLPPPHRTPYVCRLPVFIQPAW